MGRAVQEDERVAGKPGSQKTTGLQAQDLGCSGHQALPQGYQSCNITIIHGNGSGVYEAVAQL